MSARHGADLGLGHRAHPLLGRLVVDTATGRSGILRAICPEPDTRHAYADPVPRPGSGQPVAWIAPLGGGREWTAAPDAVAEAAQ